MGYLMMAVLLLAGASSAAAQTFAGTYTGRSATGAVTLAVVQTQGGSVSGTYTEAGFTWQISGTVVDGAVEGRGSYPGADFLFRLSREGAGMLIELVDIGPDGEPVESTYRQVELTPTGGTSEQPQPEPTPQPTTVPGDVNGDGALSVADVILALRLAVKLPTANAKRPEAADLDGDGSVTVGEVLRLLQAAVGLRPLTPTTPTTPPTDQDTWPPDPDGVPRLLVTNPLMGFAIRIPEDWQMSTASGGNIEISIDSPASLLQQPAVWFFYSALPPAEEAQAIARGLEAIGGGAAAQVRATGRPDEWEVTMTSNRTRGPLVERWVCRRQNGISYVVAALSKPDYVDRFKGDIEAALGSCTLVPTIASELFRDPDENAYTMRIPKGWTWVREQGRIVRTELVPGAFQWLVRSPSGTSGAFVSAPATFNIFTPFASARQCAETYVLSGLQNAVPDLQFEAFKELPRPSQYLTWAVRALGFSDGLVEKAYADYLGTVGGRRIRIRVTIVAVKWGINWVLCTGGAWAPVDRFSELYPIGSSIIASVRTDPTWAANQQKAVTDVAIGRGFLSYAATIAWSVLIRGDGEPPPPPPDAPPPEG